MHPEKVCEIEEAKVIEVIATGWGRGGVLNPRHQSTSLALCRLSYPYHSSHGMAALMVAPLTPPSF